MELLLLMAIIVGGWQIFKRILMIMDHLDIEDPSITDAREKEEKKAAKKEAKQAKKALKNTINKI